jgi:hypothetical protein
MEEHLSVLCQRLLHGDNTALSAALSQYNDLSPKQRHSFVLYWPRNNNNTTFSLVPLYRVPPEQHDEYFYYGFLVHCSKYGHLYRCPSNDSKKSGRQRKKTKRDDPNILVLPPSPQRKSAGGGGETALVRLLDWDDRVVPRHFHSAESFAQAAAEAASMETNPTLMPVHWASYTITPYTHKAFFGLRSPYLSLERALHSLVQLYHGHRWHFVASNAALLIPDPEKFCGITLHIPAQLCTIELALTSFTADADGSRSLSLASLASPNQLCYVETHGSQVLVSFDATPGTLRLCATSNAFDSDPYSESVGIDDTHPYCLMDIGYAELEYWVAASPIDNPSHHITSLAPWQQPTQYGVIGAHQLANWMIQTDAALRTLGTTEKTLLDVKSEGTADPDWFSWPRGRVSEAAELHHMLRNLRVEWSKPEMPYFSLDETGVPVARCAQSGRNYLLHADSGKAWASFIISTVPQCESNCIVFTMIPPSDAPFFDFNSQYIY